MRPLNLFEKNKVSYIKTNDIIPNPAQPRRIFDAGGLRELADSIREVGVIQPLTVRRSKGGGFELVAGERRLRASRMAGLTEVPCIVMSMSERQSSIVALIENLQRRDLDFFEEAEGIKRLIDLHGLSQEDAARRIGKSQSAVANKLRLLKLDGATRGMLKEYGLTERHARALLRLEDAARRREVLREVIERGMNVAQTDAYIDGLLFSGGSPDGGRVTAAEAPPRQGKTLYIVKDVRVFLNTVERAVGVMRSAGLPADMEKEEKEDSIVVRISIPRSAVQDTAGRRAELTAL